MIVLSPTFCANNPIVEIINTMKSKSFFIISIFLIFAVSCKLAKII